LGEITKVEARNSKRGYEESTWLFINIAKQSPMVDPVDTPSCFRSRKCFIAIQTARHNARDSHAVPITRVQRTSWGWPSAILHI
jgi:hypothetical protein